MEALKSREFRPPAPFIMCPGRKAPYFSSYAVMPDSSVKILSLKDDMFNNKMIVMIFYPGNWTRVCRSELFTISERYPDFKAVRCEVVFCSTDSHFCHLAFINKSVDDGGCGPLTFPVLDDRSQTIIKAYGVSKPDEGLSFRATFVIDPEKKIRHITVNDLPTGRDVDEILRTVKAIHYCDYTGSLCPANWVPTMEIDDEVLEAEKHFRKLSFDTELTEPSYSESHRTNNIELS